MMDPSPDDAPLVLLEVRDHIAVVTLNRPRSRNAVSSHVARQLGTIVQAIEADPTVRVAILTGAGMTFPALALT